MGYLNLFKYLNTKKKIF